MKVSAWHPRRTLFTPGACLGYLWRSAPWIGRIAVLLVAAICTFPSNPFVEVFGLVLPHNLLGIPRALITTFLGLAIFQPHRKGLNQVLAMHGFWRSSAPIRALTVTAFVTHGGENLGSCVASVWFDNGRLFVDGQRFSAAFSASEAEASGLAIRLNHEEPDQPWCLRLSTSGEERLQLGAMLAAWREEPGIREGEGILPPNEPMPPEPSILRIGAFSGHLAPFFALCGLVLVGMDVPPGLPQIVGIALCVVVALDGILRYRSARVISDNAHQALTAQITPSLLQGPQIQTLKLSNDEEPVHHRA